MAFRNDPVNLKTFDDERAAELRVVTRDRSGGVNFEMLWHGVPYPFFASYTIKNDPDPCKQHVSWIVHSLGKNMMNENIMSYQDMNGDQLVVLESLIKEALETYGYAYGVNKGTASTVFKN